MSDKIGVVVPTNRPDEMVKFKEAWAPKLEEANAQLYEITDDPDTWATIRSDLGRSAWIIPVRTDCIRSYGYLKALRDGCDVIVTLDDDVRPHEDNNPIIDHVNNLNRKVEPDNWTRTLKEESAPITRGLPMIRRVVLSHGLWSGVPDVPATIQIQGYTFSMPSTFDNQIIPRNKYFPMSGMNLAWHKGMTPFMYFGLQGSSILDPEQRWGVDRSGDILCGVMAKTMVDSIPGAAIHSGEPWVHHIRASDPIKNLELERTSEYLPYIFAVHLKGSTSYLEMAERLFHLDQPSKRYCRSLGLAMREWDELTKKG